MTRTRLAAASLLPLLAAACGPQEPIQYSVWNVDVTTVGTDAESDPLRDLLGGTTRDGCETSTGYAEAFDFHVLFDNQDVSLRIYDEELDEFQQFATGSVAGCRLVYDSVVWSSPDRDGYNVRWQVTGDASWRVTSASCSENFLGSKADYQWIGRETFTVVETDNPDTPIGCEYGPLLVYGTYEGQVEG